MIKIEKLDPEKGHREAQAMIPGSRFGSLWNLKATALDELSEALAAGPEEAIQAALTENPYLVQYAVDQSGHHGIWVFPKVMIKPRGVDGSRGLIPDFLIVAKSSLGYWWHVVELKRFDHQFAAVDGRGYSHEGQRAIAQCSAYLSHFQDYVDAVRSQVRIPDLIQPRSAILIIGDSAREATLQRSCRSDFVRTHPNIAVVSYRRILEAAQSDLLLRHSSTPHPRTHR